MDVYYLFVTVSVFAFLGNLIETIFLLFFFNFRKLPSETCRDIAVLYPFLLRLILNLGVFFSIFFFLMSISMKINFLILRTKKN